MLGNGMSYNQQIILGSGIVETPIGSMLAIGDDRTLYLLEFVDKRGLEGEVEKLGLLLKARAMPDIITDSIRSIKTELKAYFKGTGTQFNTQVHLLGTPFQQEAWHALVQIPYGQTRSYTEQACKIGKPKVCRAVANANGANRLAIIVPCHRVITSSGKLGGYAGGISRKQWLIDHEKRLKK